MPYVAAAVMLGIYMYNLPLAFAFVWKRRKFGVGVGVFEGRFAAERAEKKIAYPGKKPKKKMTSRRLKAAARGAVRLLTRGRLEHVTARLLIGTGDAARTAAVCGGAIALANALRLNASSGRVDIRPDFSGSALEGEIRITVTVTVGGLIMAKSGRIRRRQGNAK